MPRALSRQLGWASGHPSASVATVLGQHEREFAVRPQCLFSSGGYTWLDVRSELEVDEVGKVKGSVNVPFVHLKR